jgi:hypothetical protein
MNMMNADGMNTIRVLFVAWSFTSGGPLPKNLLEGQ